IEIGGGTATALVVPASGTGTYYLVSAQVGTAPQSFTAESTPVSNGSYGGYFRNSLGELVFAMRTGPGAYFRAAGSSTWAPLTAPCASRAGGAAVGSLFLNGSSEGMVAACSLGVAAGSSQKEVDISTNGGSSWQTLNAPPFPGDLSSVAAGSANNISVAAVSGASFLYSSTDGGRTWNTYTFGSSPQAAGGYGIQDLGYTTATQAFCILGSPGDATSGLSQSQMYITSDGGANWSQVSF
nr:hypothetical protein [Actinomycetota bacterium]